VKISQRSNNNNKTTTNIAHTTKNKDATPKEQRI
jgi:hypothetical protein